MDVLPDRFSYLLMLLDRSQKIALGWLSRELRAALDKVKVTPIK